MTISAKTGQRGSQTDSQSSFHAAIDLLADGAGFVQKQLSLGSVGLGGSRVLQTAEIDQHVEPGAADGFRDGLGNFQVIRIQIDVKGHQRHSGADGGDAGGGMDLALC